MKRAKKLIFILLIMALTYSLYAQTTIEEIVGLSPSIDSTYEQIKDVYGIDSSPLAKNFVSDISAIPNKGIITVNWKGIVDPNVVYYVYRYTSPIINYALIPQAKQIAEARPSDSLSVDYSINDIPDTAGNYYYAVVADVNGVAKFFTATANVDMTSIPIIVSRINGEFVASGFNPNDLNGRYVTALKVIPQSETNTMIYWQEIPGYKGQYTIYRSSFPVEGEALLQNSVVIGRTIDVFFNDVNPPSIGAYYYIDSDFSRGRVFVKNDNFSADPALFIAPVDLSKTVLRVANLNAIAEPNGIALEWTLVNSTTNSYKYLLVTSTNSFSLGLNAFYNEGIISIKRIDTNEIKSVDRMNRYIDNPSPSLHNNKPLYYALAVVFDNSATLPDMKEGMFTRYPVMPPKVQTPPVNNMGNNVQTNVQNAVTNITPPINNNENIPVNNVEPPENNIPLENNLPKESNGTNNNEYNNTNQIVSFPINNGDNTTLPPTETIKTEPPKTEVIKTEPTKTPPAVKTTSPKEVDNKYEKAVILFRDRKYKEASSALESLVIDEKKEKDRYFKVNLLLGRCYYKLGQRKKALDALRAIYDYSPQEVSFWVSQVLSDL